MLRLTNLANKYQRRTLRVLYSQTHATPYDTTLDSGFNRNAGALAGGTAITGAKAAILPGLVATKKTAETVTVSGAWASSQRAFGLFAQYVGGEMSDIASDFDKVGVWRGVGSVYEILAPAYDDTGLATAAANEAGTAATEVYLNSGAKGQLVTAGAGANVINNTARLIYRLSSNAVEVELLV